jgi:four helix bundle protein
MLDHEKLDVYQCSIAFFALAVQVIEAIPRGNSILSDQLIKASLSIPLNIAEGAGKTGHADKKRFYAISRGSAGECGAIFDACNILGIIEYGKYQQGKELLKRILEMLTKMCKI